MTSALGEWEEDATVALEDAPPATVGGLPVDVAGLAQGLLDDMIQSEVRVQVRKVVAPLVAEAVAHALTPERLDELRERATAATMAELVPESDGPDIDPAAPAPENVPPPLYYGSVDEFVRDFLVPVFSRQVGDRAARRWSAEWWRNPEAIVRLEALWRSWEHLRLDPATGMSVWLRDHADHHLGVLWDTEGPFAKSTDQARPGDPLPYTAPPEGLFPDVRAPAPIDVHGADADDTGETF